MKILIPLLLTTFFSPSAKAWYPRLNTNGHNVDSVILTSIETYMDNNCSGETYDDDTLTLISYVTTPDDDGVEFDAIFRADFVGRSGKPALYQARGMQANFDRMNVRLDVTSGFCSR